MYMVYIYRREKNATFQTSAFCDAFIWERMTFPKKQRQPLSVDDC